MTIRYVCGNCSNSLGITGFKAVNEVGRKSCDKCGTNIDDLYVVDEEKYNNAILSDPGKCDDCDDWKAHGHANYCGACGRKLRTP